MRKLRRKSKIREETNHQDRWLITYSDLITLLLIFFVIMYAMSQLDIKKYTDLANALRLQFHSGDTILQQGSGLTGDQNPYQKPKPSDKSADEKDSEALKEEQELQNLFKLINTYIQEHHLEQSISISDRTEGIAITLKDLFLFDLGDARLKPPSIPLLKQLASLFPELDNTISIEGHTDNIPIATGSLYQDNWGLSAARALSVLRFFVNEAHLDEHQFVIKGYADTKPVAKNDSKANRQKNRRVEIVVLRSES